MSSLGLHFFSCTTQTWICPHGVVGGLEKIKAEKALGTAKLGTGVGDGNYHYYCQPFSSNMKVGVGGRKGTPPFFHVG